MFGRTLAGALLLGACAPRPVEMSDLVGRWAWQGMSCSEGGLEIRRDRILATKRSGQSNPILRVLEEPPQGRNADEFFLHVQDIPHAGLADAERLSIARGEQRRVIVLRLEGDRITPRYVLEGRTARPLTPASQTYRLFDVHRCA